MALRLTPRATLSLIIFTSQNHIMSVPINSKETVLDPATAQASARLDRNATGEAPLWKKRDWKKTLRVLNPIRKRPAPAGHVSFANPAILIWLTGGEYGERYATDRVSRSSVVYTALWTLITIANVFALYELGAGDS